MCLLQEAKSSDKLTVDVSPDVVKTIAQADIGRRSANGKGKDSKDVEKQLSDQMVSCCVKQVPVEQYKQVIPDSQADIIFVVADTNCGPCKAACKSGH